jgi:hypothetical protein
MSVLSRKSLSKQELIEKAGPVGGSALSILGSLLVMIGFLLPWASCGGSDVSGWDLAVKGGDYFGTSSTYLLCLVPLFALGLLGIGLVVIPSTLIKKIPGIVKPIAAVLLPLLVFFACCPSVIFLARIQAERTNAANYGIGNYIQVGYGFWLSVFGLFLALIGGLIAAGTAGGDYLVKRKQSPAEEPAPVETTPETPSL